MANLVAQWSKLATGRSTSNSILDMIVDFCNFSNPSCAQMRPVTTNKGFPSVRSVPLKYTHKAPKHLML